MLGGLLRKLRKGKAGPSLADRYGRAVGLFLRAKPVVLGVTLLLLAAGTLLPTWDVEIKGASSFQTGAPSAVRSRRA